MSWRVLLAMPWAMAAAAQTLPQITITMEAPDVRMPTVRSWREFAKNYRSEHPSVCSIPLTEVPVAKNVEPMPILRPPKPVEPMPMVPLPAPPCKEEKR
jgi:hypothetical protein